MSSAIKCYGLCREGMWCPAVPQSVACHPLPSAVAGAGQRHAAGPPCHHTLPATEHASLHTQPHTFLRQPTLQVGPELEIPGYGCEDHFAEQDTVEHSWVRFLSVMRGGMRGKGGW